MSNDRFANYTRSTAFSVTLSANMIGELLRLHTAADLMSRYYWYEPWKAHNFGSVEETVANWGGRSTVQALVRRGLLDLVPPKTLPVAYHQVVKLTPAGSLMCELLIEAGFDLVFPPCQVPCHPDDRIPLRFDGDDIKFEARPRDRRLDLMLESDRPHLSFLHEETENA